MHFGFPAQGAAWANLDTIAAGDAVRIIYRQPPMGIISNRNTDRAVIAADSTLHTTVGVRDYPPQSLKILRVAVLPAGLQAQ